MKITVHKKVFWNAGDREMTGEVKQIMADHVLVRAGTTDYLVRKTACSLRSSRIADKDAKEE